MSNKAGRERGPVRAEPAGEERSGVQPKAPEHELSRAVAATLLEGPDDDPAEERAWAALVARLRAIGVDPET